MAGGIAPETVTPEATVIPLGGYRLFKLTNEVFAAV
jgi:hypothetical protein